MVTATQAKPLEPAFSRKGDYYNYTPCIIQEEDGQTRYVFYCANRTPGDVTDYICYRKAERKPEGWVWGQEKVALAPGKERSLWDSRHVCDPDIVAGRFRYAGKEWSYALFYLGCDAESSRHNQVGAAFSNSLNGPWLKYPEPIVRYTQDPAGGIVGTRDGWPVYRYWGVGQPAAVSLDGGGKVWLFFSRGEEETGEEMVEIDLSDMDAGMQSGPRRKVPTEGLKRADGGPLGVLMNIGLLYDKAHDRFFMVREGELPPGDGRFPGFVSSYVQLAQISGEDLRAGRGIWHILANIGPETTGWPRNHNAFLLRDARGYRIDPKHLTLGISVAQAFDQAPPAFAWLWTYRIVLLDMEIGDGSAAPRR
jgi:hypothetical protein